MSPRRTAIQPATGVRRTHNHRGRVSRPHTSTPGRVGSGQARPQSQSCRPSTPTCQNLVILRRASQPDGPCGTAHAQHSSQSPAPGTRLFTGFQLTLSLALLPTDPASLLPHFFRRRGAGGRTGGAAAMAAQPVGHVRRPVGRTPRRPAGHLKSEMEET